MTAEWSVHPLGPFAEVQDPLQHWLLVPTGDDDGDSWRDLVVAYVFEFTSETAYREFFDQTNPNKTTDAEGPTVNFPDLVPVGLQPDEEVVTVGFARLGDVGAVTTLLARNEFGTAYLSGVPVDGPEGGPPMGAIGQIDGMATITGIIDTDIAFANERFRVPGSMETRIIGYWDQDAGINVGPLFLGIAIGKTTIDDYLAEFNQNGNVDEAALYEAFFTEFHPKGTQRRIPGSEGHGTHVLDVAAGGDGEDSQILAVDLRQRAVDATHGGLLLPWIVLGALWIVQVSQAASVPAINFSFGALAGRHDGQSPLELFFDRLIASNRVSAITLPAGNFCGTDTHASFTGADLAKGKTLSWRVQPDDGTSNVLEIWLPACRPNDPFIEFDVMSPTGVTGTFTDTGFSDYHELRDNGKVLARIYVQCLGLFGATPRTRITIVTRHTAYYRDHFQFRGGMPDLAGPWKITLRAMSIESDQRVELWIERDDALRQARNGARQSYFDAPRPVWPDEAPPNEPVTNAGTLSDIATGSETVVTAGYLRKSGQPASYSSEGFITHPRHLPALAAISDDSLVHGGILASGFYSGSTRPMNGTSVAAALAAQRVKIRMAGALPVTKAAMEAVAEADYGSTPPADGTPNPVFGTYADPPATRIGAGELSSDWTRLPRFVD